jgi:hypothetical protein|tara:strand:- start:373 stop:552 length:180 start_codon:yes stop_codon:yes gene_type:complete
MKSNSKVRQYDKLKKEFKLILKHEENGQCLESYLAFKRIPKHFSKIVKIENAEAKRANS